MLKRMRHLLTVAGLAAFAVVALFATGHLHLPESLGSMLSAKSGQDARQAEPPLPTVTVLTPVSERIEQKVLVTGTLVARREILIAPEIEGSRIVALLVEEGDRVTLGQPLARLDREVLTAKLAENEAALARSDAAIAQAGSSITQSEARRDEAKSALARATPLLKTRIISESLYEQREAAARTTEAQLVAARDGLKVANAERKQIEAQRRELEWRLSKTTILAPAAGVISRRNAKIGSVASGAGVAQPMFHLVEDGDIELEAEVPEAEVSLLRVGQPATVTLPGGSTHTGTVRLVSPEIDRATRLGSIRISLDKSDFLRVGGFARGTVLTATAEGLVVPLTALAFTPEGPRAKIVVDGRIVTRPVETGIRAGGNVEIRSGISESDTIVAKAGSFLRDGDGVRPVPATGPNVTEVK